MGKYISKYTGEEIDAILDKAGSNVATTERFAIGDMVYLDGASELDKETISVSNATYDEETETIILK